MIEACEKTQKNKQKAQDSDEKLVRSAEKWIRTHGRHVAIQETTQIPVYQVADPFSPLDVPAKLPLG